MSTTIVLDYCCDYSTHKKDDCTLLEDVRMSILLRRYYLSVCNSSASLSKKIGGLVKVNNRYNKILSILNLHLPSELLSSILTYNNIVMVGGMLSSAEGYGCVPTDICEVNIVIYNSNNMNPIMLENIIMAIITSIRDYVSSDSNITSIYNTITIGRYKICTSACASLTELLYKTDIQSNQIALSNTGIYHTPMYSISKKNRINIIDYKNSSPEYNHNIHDNGISSRTVGIRTLIPRLIFSHDSSRSMIIISRDIGLRYKLSCNPVIRYDKQEEHRIQNHSLNNRWTYNLSHSLLNSEELSYPRYLLYLCNNSHISACSNCGLNICSNCIKLFTGCNAVEENKSMLMDVIYSPHASKTKISRAVSKLICTGNKYRYLPADPQSIILFLMSYKYDNNCYHHILPPELIVIIIEQLLFGNNIFN